MSAVTATRGLVEVHNVRKSFHGVEVLKGIDLTVEPGEVVAILGASGSGKSTLLRTINHLETVDRGSVTVDGEFIGYEQRNGKLYELREITSRTPKPVVASGGISSLDDIAALRELVPLGVEGAIVGKALYAGAFTLAEALDVAGD